MEVNSGKIFAESRIGEINILPLFTEIEKNNCLSIDPLSDLKDTFCGLLCASPWIFNISASLMVAKREFTPAILFCLDRALSTP